MTTPPCTIIAGPNGAGKTTFALTYLPKATECRNFVNADLIASGLAPLAPEREVIGAGRLFLNEIRGFVSKRESFAFETTLAGRSYLKMTREMVDGGWQVDLVYLWLPGIDVARDRVAERVASCGHDVPVETIARRYPRSIFNLLNYYSTLCTSTICLDNSRAELDVVFTQTAAGRVIENGTLFTALEEGTRT